MHYRNRGDTAGQRPQRAVLTKSVLPVTAKGEIRRRQITDEMLDDPGNTVQIYKR